MSNFSEYKLPWLKQYTNKFYDKQEALQLNKQLRKTLKRQGASRAYIEIAKYLPVEHYVRKSSDLIEVIIYKDGDFKKKELTFDKKINISEYMMGLEVEINDKIADKRPRLVKKGIATQANVLINGYRGWYNKGHILKKKMIDLWPYKPVVSGSYTGFYIKDKKGEIGWVYFPIRKEEKQELKNMLRD